MHIAAIYIDFLELTVFLHPFLLRVESTCLLAADFMSSLSFSAALDLTDLQLRVLKRRTCKLFFAKRSNATVDDFKDSALSIETNSNSDPSHIIGKIFKSISPFLSHLPGS